LLLGEVDQLVGFDPFGGMDDEAGDGLFRGANSVLLILPVEDGDITFGNAEAMNILQGEGRFGFAATSIPICEALLPTGLDRGLKIRCFHCIDVNGAELVRLLTKDGEARLVHERR
jgi:hypothetical protein